MKNEPDFMVYQALERLAIDYSRSNNETEQKIIEENAKTFLKLNRPDRFSSFYSYFIVRREF